MRLDCSCGRTYRTADHDCPECGQTLTPRADDAPKKAIPPGADKVDPAVLVRQKMALRDELRVRDRQLRQAEARIAALQAQLERMLARGQEIRIAASPLRVIETRIAPSELSLERPDLSMLPLAEETPALKNAIPLPDDRLPALDVE
ncbi:MAG TPA: hypothetical protein VF950_01985 [Planctomycetota bacterium]